MATGPDQALNKPTVLLAGASSQIGLFAIPYLLDAGFDIIAVSRGGKPGDLPQLERVNWLDEPGAMQFANECEYLLSTGPMSLAQNLMQAGGRLRSVIAFSSTSAQTKIDSLNQLESRQAQELLELESNLHSIALERGIKLVIFRPTLVYGCGLDANISLLANWIRRFGFVPVNGQATGLRQPVHADDLAALAVRTLQLDAGLPGLMTVCGGETLSYSEMVSRIFPAVERPVRLLRLPGWLFVFLVGLVKLFKQGSGINREMVKRQNTDLVFDDREARQLLGYDPRPFEPGVRDFSLPEF